MGNVNVNTLRQLVLPGILCLVKKKSPQRYYSQTMVIFCINYFNRTSNWRFSAATTLVIQQRALKGLSAAALRRGFRLAEPLPPPAWCVHALFSSPGGWRCVPKRTAPDWGGGRANEESRQTAPHRHIPAASVSRRQPWRAAAGRRAIYLRTPECGGRMAGGRRGLVAPQNTFLENIVRRSNGKDENESQPDH